MSANDEKALLERARDRDRQALGELYDRYSRKIYSYVLYHVGDENLAEDLTASVFIKVLGAIDSSKAWDLSFSGWLYRIAHNAVVDNFRRRKNQTTLPLDEGLVAVGDDPVSTAEGHIAFESVKAALVYLTDEQRTVVQLKFFEQLTNLEVAGVMGKTEGAIKSLQYRALASLRRHIDLVAGEKDAETALGGAGRVPRLSSAR